MSNSFKNVFGEERIQTPLFETGNAVLDSILYDWFFDPISGSSTGTLGDVAIDSTSTITDVIGHQDQGGDGSPTGAFTGTLGKRTLIVTATIAQSVYSGVLTGTLGALTSTSSCLH
jgi:hypothetical protein